MKNALLQLALLAVLVASCDVAVTINPSQEPTTLPPPTSPPATTIVLLTAVPAPDTPVPPTLRPPDPTSTLLPPAPTPVQVSGRPLSLVVPTGLANGVMVSQVSRAEGEGVAPWDVTPGHTRLVLDAYPLSGRSFAPEIRVYPASDYALMYPAAFESIHRLDNILYGPNGLTGDEPLPDVPYLNASEMLSSRAQVLPFQSGSGVRFLTQYDQYAAPINNNELIYTYQGLSRDGTYYIVATLPVTLPVLPESSDPAAVVPPGGVAYPGQGQSSSDYEAYYAAVTGLLDSANSGDFAPSIDQLDQLIASMLITP